MSAPETGDQIRLKLEASHIRYAAMRACEFQVDKRKRDLIQEIAERADKLVRLCHERHESAEA